MQVFVDESGDPGMSAKPGSSTYFVVAAVIFDTGESAAACRQAIRTPRTKLCWGERQEFKFNKSHDNIRTAFFETIRTQQFTYNAVVVNKQALGGPGFRFKDSFYNYTVRLVFTNAKPWLNDATVVMDQCGSRDFRDQMQKYLQAQVADRDGSSPIRRVRTEKSHACELVQMADMVVGAVARSYQANRDAGNVYRQMIRHRERDVQLWPR